MNFSFHFLFASLIWSSVGAGYCLYGRRQQSYIPFVAGVMMITASFFLSAWVMSLACLALMLGVYWLLRQGY